MSQDYLETIDEIRSALRGAQFGVQSTAESILSSLAAVNCQMLKTGSTPEQVSKLNETIVLYAKLLKEASANPPSLPEAPLGNLQSASVVAAEAVVRDFDQ